MTPKTTKSHHDVLRELITLYRTCEVNIRDAFYGKITLDEMNNIMEDLHNQIEQEVNKLNDL